MRFQKFVDEAMREQTASAGASSEQEEEEISLLVLQAAAEHAWGIRLRDVADGVDCEHISSSRRQRTSDRRGIREREVDSRLTHPLGRPETKAIMEPTTQRLESLKVLKKFETCSAEVK